MKKSFLETDYGKSLIDNGAYLKRQYEALGQEAFDKWISSAVSWSAHNKTMFVLTSSSMHDLTESPNIYRFSDDFAFELAEVRIDIELSRLKLPKMPILIELPDTLFRTTLPEEGDSPYPVNAILIGSIGQSYQAVLLSSHSGGCLQVSIRFSTTDFKDAGSVNAYWARELKKVEAWAEQEKITAAELIDVRENSEKIWYFIFNALLYIQSGDPDLREYSPPQKPPGFKGRERSWRKLHKDQSMYPMTLIGYGYKKPPMRYVDSTMVAGHFRWQPYGEGFSKIKLIWIETHERVYKKENEEPL